MRQNIIIIALLCIGVTAMAQTVNIHKTDGTIVKHNYSSVNYLDFSQAYHLYLSSGSVVSYDKSKVSYINFTWPTIAVTTNDATNVGATTATLNGSVSATNTSVDYTAGFFFSKTNSIPSSDNYSKEIKCDKTNPTGSFTASAKGLDGVTKYYYRAYVLCDGIYYYGATKIFTTDEVKPTCPDTNHPHLIDLGLPSGTKWACCNVGASKPEGYGNYYAWGETTTKSWYYWSNYQYATSQDNYINIGDNIAGTKYDTATAIWGSPWCMPSNEQILELLNYCKSTSTTHNDVKGYMISGPNGGTIFLPAAGVYVYDELAGKGSRGAYWSSTVASYSACAYNLSFKKSIDRDSSFRMYGLSVRPVQY